MWQSAPPRMPVPRSNSQDEKATGTLAKMPLSGQQFNRIQLLLVRRPFSIPRR